MRKYNLNLDEYGISKNRYNELSNFCLQYPEWKDELKYKQDALASPKITGMPTARGISNSTADMVVKREKLLDKCKTIEQTAIETDSSLYQYIIQCVTRQEVGYRYLREIMNIPCSKNEFYKIRRKFFWILDKYKN